MPEQENIWHKDTIDFDEYGRLVIKSPELAKAIHEKFKQCQKLEIRINPFEEQNRTPIDNLDFPETPPADPENPPVIYKKELEAKLIAWPGVNPYKGSPYGDNPGGGTPCPIPPHPTDLGCGCDIRINVNCN